MHTSSITVFVATLAGISNAAPLESRTAYTAPKGIGSFNLEVVAVDGNVAAFTGQWLNLYHTGAGTNALVLTNDQSAAEKFNFTTSSGDVTTLYGSNPAYLDLATSDDYAPPKGYAFAGFDITVRPGHHFFFSTPDNYLQFPAADASKKYNWAVCEAEVYTEGVYEPTLVYREAGAKKNSTCAGVLVKAVF